jgi:hypothetical protein
MASGATVWWWVVPPAQQGDTSRPGSAQLISTTTSGALYTALLGNGTGTLNGQQVSRFQGPFTSESEARAANPAGGSEAQVIAAGAGAGLQAAGGVGLPTIPGASAANPLAGLGDVAAALKAFYSAVTDGKMWRSVAWILLGALLVFNGIVLWLRIPQRGAAVAAAGARAAI